MKQPELGKKIQELRKAKGLTQEELVELCNINVRTIQRIEAGEVTPRSYTIKSILDALGYDFESIQMRELNLEQNPIVTRHRYEIKTAGIVGVIYIVLALVESFFDFGLAPFGEIRLIGVGWYIAVKTGVIISFGIFTLGFYRLGTIYPNTLLKVVSILLIIILTIILLTDIHAYLFSSFNSATLMLLKALIFGPLYIVLGVSLTKYQFQLGNLALVAGILGILSGVAIVTVIFAIPGLVILTMVEILQVVILFKAHENLSHNKKAAEEISMHAFS